MIAECEIEDVETQQPIDKDAYAQAIRSIEAFCHEQINPKNGGVRSVTCPHCNHIIAPQWQRMWSHTDLIGAALPNNAWNFVSKRGNDTSNNTEQRPGKLYIQWTACTNEECFNIIVQAFPEVLSADSPFRGKLGKLVTIFPRFAEAVIDLRIEDPYLTEYKEAYATLQVSERLSVVGSRKLLERLLQEFGDVSGKLYEMIEAFTQQGNHPGNVTDPLHAIREFGNIGAHPDEIQVAPEEAKWTLDTVRDLFDYFIIKPAENKKRIDALKQKKSQAKSQ